MFESKLATLQTKWNVVMLKTDAGWVGMVQGRRIWGKCSYPPPINIRELKTMWLCVGQMQGEWVWCWTSGYGARKRSHAPWHHQPMTLTGMTLHAHIHSNSNLLQLVHIWCNHAKSYSPAISRTHLPFRLRIQRGATLYLLNISNVFFSGSSCDRGHCSCCLA